ncbi:MAG: hypothetical protein SGPRY_003591, partial [Prymnesium sp.]
MDCAPLPQFEREGGETPLAFPERTHEEAHLASLPIATSLSSLGLSESVLGNYAKRGITSLFPWQANALSLPGVLSGGSNLLYTAPTSGGKTLVAEILILRSLLSGVHDFDRPCKALFVVPLKALVEEKARYFEEICRGTGLRVQRYMHGSGVLPMPRSLHVAVCTNEKAAMVVQSMALEGRLEEIRVVVFDEFHGVGGDRGVALEVTIAKLLLHARSKQSASLCGSSASSSEGEGQGQCERGGGYTQIVGMTATMANTRHVARWLQPCEVYEDEQRPVPLVERIVDREGRLCDHLGSPTGETLSAGLGSWAGEMEVLSSLCLEVGRQDKQVLVFCATKDACERLARGAAAWQAGSVPEGRVEAAVDALHYASPGGISRGLEACVRSGVAYFHAELTDEEKRAVEICVRELRAIRIVFATSALAEGVNLPVRRVIFHQLYVGIPSNKIDPIRYRQMAGRAGRVGYEEGGEVFLLARGPADVHSASSLIRATPPAVCSRLGEKRLRDEGLLVLLLEAVSAGAVCSVEQARQLLQCTLWWHDQQSKGSGDIGCKAGELIKKLLERTAPLLEWRVAKSGKGESVGEEAGTLRATPRGRGSASASALIQCGTGGMDAIADELVEWLGKGVYLLDDLHLLFLCVSSQMMKDPKYTEQGALCPEGWNKRFARLAWPMAGEGGGGGGGGGGRGGAGRGYGTGGVGGAAGGRGGETHLGRVAQFVCPGITPQYCDGDSVPSRGLREKLRRLWLARMLQVLIRSREPAGQLRAEMGVAGAASLPAKLLEDAAKHAGALVRWCDEMEKGDGGEEKGKGGRRERVRVGGGAEMCERASYAHVLVLMRQLAEQLRWGARAELLPLLEPKLPSMSVRIASALYSQGYRSLEMVAASSKASLLRALRKGGSGKGGRKMQAREAERLLAEARNLQSHLAEERALAQRAFNKEVEAGESEEEAAGGEGSEDECGEDGKRRGEEGGGGRGRARVRRAMEGEGEEGTWGGRRPGSGRAVTLHPLPAPPGLGRLRARVRRGAHGFLEDLRQDWLRSGTFSLSLHLPDDSRRLPPYSHLSILGACIGLGKVVYYLPLTGTSEVEDAWEVFREALSNPKLCAIIPDLKQATALLLRHSTHLRARLADPKIVASLLSPNSNERPLLKKLVTEYLSPIKRRSARVLSEGRKGREMVENMDPNANRKRHHRLAGGLLQCAQVASYASALQPRLEMMLIDQGLPPSLCSLETKVAQSLAKMELAGVHFSLQRLSEQREMAMAAMARLEERSDKLGVSSFSWRSSHEVGRVLFDELRLGEKEGRRRLKSKGLRAAGCPWETSSEALELLREEHPLPGMICEHRQLASFVQMVGSCEKFSVGSDAAGCPVLHAIHPLQLQLEASANGRVHTADPNLQNLPKEVRLKAAGGESETLSPRSCFLAEAGFVLLSADFCQIELRMLAHFSRDEQLRRIIRAGSDPFKQMAASMHGIDPEAVSANQRKQVKCAVYKFIYGCGPDRIAKELGLGVEQTKAWLDKWLATFPDIKRFMQEAYASCRRVGYVETIAGRRRHIEAILSDNAEDVSRGERQAFNAILQGSAADIFKHALVRVDAALHDPDGEHVSLPAKPRGQLILGIHDEVLCRVQSSAVEDLRKSIREAM